MRLKYWKVNNTCHSCSIFQPKISVPLKSTSLSLSFCWNWNTERLSDLFIYLFVIYLLCPSKSVMELGIGDKISDALFSFRPLTLLKCSQWRLVTFTFISQASSLLNWHAYLMLKNSQKSQRPLLWSSEFRAKLLWTIITLKITELTETFIQWVLSMMSQILLTFTVPYMTGTVLTALSSLNQLSHITALSTSAAIIQISGKENWGIEK